MAKVTVLFTPNEKLSVGFRRGSPSGIIYSRHQKAIPNSLLISPSVVPEMIYITWITFKNL